MAASRRLLLGALLAAALAAPGCASTPSDNGDTSSPPASTSPTSSSASPSSTERALALYWVQDTPLGLRLYREFVRVPVVDESGGAVRAALEALFTTRPQDPDYLSLWPQGTQATSVTVEGDVAVVDLSFPRPSWGSDAEAKAIAQLVWTVTAADTSVTRVRLLVDGQRVESLAGHVDATTDLARGDSHATLAAIWITAPLDGAEVTGPLVVEGVASTFEANVAWDILKDGTVVRSGSTIAGEAAPARTPWSFTITDLPPGRYVVRAREYSAKDGSLAVEDTKTVVLR